MRNYKLYYSLKSILIKYDNYIIEKIEKRGTETYKFELRKGGKNNREYKNLKVRCYLLDKFTYIHPVEDIISCTKKAEKKCPYLPKIVIVKKINNFLITISEWGDGARILNFKNNKIKFKKAVKSYGKFLKNMEELNIFFRDSSMENIIYNDEKDFSYYCDFGRLSLYVKDGNEKFKEMAMNYKKELLRKINNKELEKSFYEGYNKEN